MWQTGCLCVIRRSCAEDGCRSGRPGPSMEMPDNLAESIQTAVSGAVSSALAPVLRGLQSGPS